jgi:hypothetical protein
MAVDSNSLINAFKQGSELKLVHKPVFTREARTLGIKTLALILNLTQGQIKYD